MILFGHPDTLTTATSVTMKVMHPTRIQVISGWPFGYVSWNQKKILMSHWQGWRWWQECTWQCSFNPVLFQARHHPCEECYFQGKYIFLRPCPVTSHWFVICICMTLHIDPFFVVKNQCHTFNFEREMLLKIDDGSKKQVAWALRRCLKAFIVQPPVCFISF